MKGILSRYTIYTLIYFLVLLILGIMIAKLYANEQGTVNTKGAVSTEKSEKLE